MVRKPRGIDERPEQLREPVVKNVGVTASERYLGALAERSFLNLWSYPSPYRDQRSGLHCEGKELCDLLVVCGNHIIIFSEKTIVWPDGELQLAWCRWARRAIRDSAKQARGAERWIREHPDRIFIDQACRKPFPIELPSPDVAIFHLVIVAQGANQSCKQHSKSSSGSFVVKPSLLGNDHWPADVAVCQPFAIGDIEPGRSFIHVFDEFALDIVMTELDTIRDFTDYLEKRAAFIRSGKLLEAHGEENLLAFYAIRINEHGDHDFVLQDKRAPITITSDRYQRLIADPRYIAKKHEDEVSYVWDTLIKCFTDHMLGGTSITIGDFDFDLRKNEVGVRYMALQQRYVRRAFGQAVLEALRVGKGSDRFFRVMMAPAGARDNETAFFIHTFKYLDWMDDKGGYDKYRLVRSESAAVYAKGLLERFPHLHRVVGISREPPDQQRGISEDLIYAEQVDWTDDERAKVRADCKAIGVMQNLTEKPWQGQEFPDVQQIVVQRRQRGGPNRKDRRAMKAKLRRKGR